MSGAMSAPSQWERISLAFYNGSGSDIPYGTPVLLDDTAIGDAKNYTVKPVGNLNTKWHHIVGVVHDYPSMRNERWGRVIVNGVADVLKDDPTDGWGSTGIAMRIHATSGLLIASGAPSYIFASANETRGMLLGIPVRGTISGETYAKVFIKRI